MSLYPVKCPTWFGNSLCCLMIEQHPVDSSARQFVTAMSASLQDDRDEPSYNVTVTARTDCPSFVRIYPWTRSSFFLLDSFFSQNHFQHIKILLTGKPPQLCKHSTGAQTSTEIRSTRFIVQLRLRLDHLLSTVWSSAPTGFKQSDVVQR